MSVIIKYCSSCADKNLAHDYQDKTYGKFVRVMNAREKGGGKCTVCGSVFGK